MCLCALAYTLYMKVYFYTGFLIVVRVIARCKSKCCLSGQSNTVLKIREKQIGLPLVAYSCAEIWLCFTSKKVESLKAQRRSVLAQCLLSYRIQLLSFE